MDIRTSYDQIVHEITSLAHACGRAFSSIRIMAVSKTQSVDAIREAVDAGIMLFGENRVQELETKVTSGAFREGSDGTIPEVHLIGHLQSNKVAKAVEFADSIDSVDSLKLCMQIARQAERAGKTMDILLQCNCSQESSKSGFDIRDLTPIQETLHEARYFHDVVRIRGLMTIGPLLGDDEQVRSSFRILHDLFYEYKAQFKYGEEWDTLSMGMSSDYTLAIEEGSTLVRIGSALFGSRIPQNTV